MINDHSYVKLEGILQIQGRTEVQKVQLWKGSRKQIEPKEESIVYDQQDLLRRNLQKMTPLYIQKIVTMVFLAIITGRESQLVVRGESFVY